MDTALNFGIPSNTIIMKNRDKPQNYDSSNSCLKRLRACVHEDVDEAVLKWMHTMRVKNVPISRPFVIENALQFAKALRYDQFLGSNGWPEKFKKRCGFVAKALPGESKDIDDNDRTIHNSFTKAGFFVSSESTASTKDEDNIPLEEMKKYDTAKGQARIYTDGVLLDDFLSLGPEAETSGSITELHILNSVKIKTIQQWIAMKTMIKQDQ
ncbi:tigger transposable element-derived protein 4 [Trichonephila clavipes]|nr:tigger transposable element-derived protein 4 [Trichonephila clavipes]